MNCIAPKCPRPRCPGSLFCRPHEAAPAGKRGGWISAEKRRRKMANLGIPLDVSNIARRLWMGGCPPFDRDLPEFDMLVLCARELQPAAEQLAYRGQLLRCPLPDDQLTTDEMHAAVAAAKAVSRARADGRTVLVTCMQGRNRSGLVTALSLGMTTRATAAQIIEVIRRRRRPDALTNPHFCAILERLIRR